MKQRVKYKILLFLLLGTTISLTIYSQSGNIKELEQKRKATLVEIARTSKLLKENKNKTNNTINRLNLISKQIKDRQEVISILNTETSTLTTEIAKKETDIKILENELRIQKDNFAKALRLMYKTKSAQDYILFILSSESFSQSLRRMRYLKNYAQWKKDEAEDIINKQKKIGLEKNALSRSRYNKISLIRERENEESNLRQEEIAKKTEIQNLKKQQFSLNADLRKKQRLADLLNRRIEQAIEEETARAEREAKAAAEARRIAQRNKAEREARAREQKNRTASRNKTKKGSKYKNIPATPEPSEPEMAEKSSRISESAGGYAMTGAEMQLSSRFAGNRGRLPFPLRGSYKIVSHFGINRRSKYVESSNNGIDIQTSPGNDARAVFSGVVSQVFVVPGAHNNIIIRHGNYLTVYCYLESIYVRPGQTVSTGQALGRIYTDKEDNSTILHFEIRKEKEKLNPEIWLR